MSRSRTIAALLLAAAAACGRAEEQPSRVLGQPGWPLVARVPADARPAFERVILVTIDTLRADHVSAYGYPRQTTPFLDRLARQGVLFERAVASISHTAPSHATMLTGLQPAVHGLVTNGGRLDPGALDLAQLFHAAGYETAAFLNVQFLEGITGSFDVSEVRTAGQQDGHPLALTGEHVVSAALGWLRKRRTNERFFLWVHLYDPHRWKGVVLERGLSGPPIWPDSSGADFYPTLERLHGLPAQVPGQPFDVGWTAGLKDGEALEVATPEQYQRCIDAYDLLTNFADHQLQRLYEGIGKLGLPGRELWVVTADHGEGLASHGVAGHGGRIYQEQLHVPLVLCASDGSLGPRRVAELVGHVDLLPTLAEVLGQQLSGSEGLYEGRSLWPLLRGEGGWSPRPAFAQRRPGEESDEVSEMYALQTAEHKFILNEPGQDEFYDLERDPNELSNAIDSGAPARAQLEADLRSRLERYRGLARDPGVAVPEEWARELRELGY